MVQDRLVGTGEAAKALSVDRSTLDRWAREGLVTPAGKTAGGHNRWDVEDLKRQVRELHRDG
ncbi:MerR family DNA-binding transcriptional regulator [Amycolatopsis acidicola]|uniref:MerR family DNA-binding transcriptional regulator n=1 Tax=Amycolatopsis acidicola TaxID=2596893 RepID=A0A5N0UX35_9PSEU|nr:MerR family DNA-binding transcriptional regulator [Amycolatopsis acidicola]KAA9155530.1 MerR family DNA-binding transcriptional regulator [Amycolatopsis acidicola]